MAVTGYDRVWQGPASIVGRLCGGGGDSGGEMEEAGLLLMGKLTALLAQYKEKVNGLESENERLRAMYVVCTKSSQVLNH